ncbi:MAG: hypothetical protein CMF58_00815 [Lentimicrobiaceae bacterium]|nr:hypothetical protein [Lentimicrobiaceae bacterium]
MKHILLLFLIIAITLSDASSQNQPLTVAESSNFMSTGEYNDVIKFISELQERNSKYLTIDTIGYSIQGNPIPLMIMGNPLPSNHNDIGERLVVYLQANIHAGEVEGKEAVQMLARDLLKDPNSELMKNLVLLITPILNIDGNDKISTSNRRNQVGPVNGVGVRYNGQQLDLNRDAMKMETPEIKAVITRVLNTWDPQISVDCHTTNGSFHEEPITFTWMQNPNGDRSLINYMRDKMMPNVRDTLDIKYNVDNIYYGVFVDRLDYSKGWLSYASEPRYLVNYIGLRNRLAILNENYVYADYKTRILGCYNFLLTVLEYASQEMYEIKDLLLAADASLVSRFSSSLVSDSFAIRYAGKATPEPITIMAFETDTIPGVQGYGRFKKSDRRISVTIPYIADYYATKNVKFPFAYLITSPDPEIIETLTNHGIQIEVLSDNMVLTVEEYKISELKPSSRINQGHYNNIASGNYQVTEKTFQKGTLVVYTEQKLGNVIAALLEPEAQDCLLKWNYFDRYLTPQWGSGYYPYPVYKITSPVVLEID